MKNKIFKPLFDKVYTTIFVFLAIFMIVITVINAKYPIALWIMIFTDIFTFYFLISPCFAYVELREKSVFIKFGFIMKREIFYKEIRTLEKQRRFYSDSLLSIKNSMEHVNIKYNTFDAVSVSVVGNDSFIEEVESRIRNEIYTPD